ncbi:MAG: PHB depolymerase family esterase [Elusimicrobia bacterium]|nr:PHB depolymerase family esterase [Elusimicrobiota bacterium]MDE2509894.1 PHB depolymerase family esterase [Elusimicrobiota bacterium]
MPAASAAALAALLSVAGVQAPPPAAGFLNFPEAGVFLPADKIFVPARLKTPAPLVVVLHGCEQDADAIAAVSHWNDLAEKEGFLVLYPNQQWGRNPYNCWNWFAPLNQAPSVGEPAEIIAGVAAAEAAYDVDPARVYVAGISAGAATAVNLLSCYPNVFAGGGVHSGVAYAIATNASDALDVMKNGPGGRARLGVCDPSVFQGGVMVVQGSSDTVIQPANAERIVADFSRATARSVFVPGLGHAWSGGAPNLPASDPRGPDATGLMWSFFSGFRRR